MQNKKIWSWRRALGLMILCAAGALAFPQYSSTLAAAERPSQSTQDWEMAAGGNMAFESASVSQNITAVPGGVYFNFPIGPGDVYIPNGGVFRVRNLPLPNLIMFAYKMTPNQEQSLISQLPQWAITYRFDVDGKAEGNPTKDQMRLMVQSLLADRFNLRVHYETRQIPILALVQDGSGQLGPLLQRHPDESSCPTTPGIPTPPPTAPPQTIAIDTRFPVTCGGIVGMAASGPGRVRTGARNVSMDLIANSISESNIGEDRPVVNKTGLTGNFDFAIEFGPEVPRSANPGSRAHTAAPTFAEALQEQLGLKLVPQTGSLDVLVIDFIQELPPN